MKYEVGFQTSNQSFPVQFSGSHIGSTANPTPCSTIILPASKWEGSNSPYAQQVAIDGVTPTSKINLQMSAAQLEELRDIECAFVAENYDGVVIIKATGDKPEIDITMQFTIKEVQV